MLLEICSWQCSTFIHTVWGGWSFNQGILTLIKEMKINVRFKRNFFLTRLEDCDCFGAQKKDEPNDKEKKEEEDTSTSVHHSIIETWDWGRQPGGSATSARLKCILLCPTVIRSLSPVRSCYFMPFCFPVGELIPCWHHMVSKHLNVD